MSKEIAYIRHTLTRGVYEIVEHGSNKSWNCDYAKVSNYISACKELGLNVNETKYGGWSITE